MGDSLFVYFSDGTGGLVMAGGRLTCELCGEIVTLPILEVGTPTEIAARAMDRHFNRCPSYRTVETEEAMRIDDELYATAPKCSRCQRYAKSKISPGNALHRACYGAECACRCSYPEEPRAI